ncbi:MAG: hypothetical protein Q8S54_19855 [Bacteroidota bacterium]|nr:hypothetical protein [Bacteroidota bacterium]
MVKDKINILILSTKNEERLLEEIAKANEAAGAETEISAIVINPLDIILKIQRNDITLKAYKRFASEGEEITANQLRDIIPQFDAIIPILDSDRAGHYGLNVVRQFQLQNIYATASSYAIENCLNEFKASQLIIKDRTEKDMPISSKLLINGPADLRQTIDLAGGYPLKCTVTKRGKKYADVLIENDESAVCLLKSVNDLESEIILSPFIRTAHEKTEYIKAIVFDGHTPQSEIIAYSVTVPFDYKNKNSLDGITAPIELDSHEKRVVGRAARLLYLDFAEITLIRDMNGLGSTIISISGKPDIEAAENATGENISAALIKHVIETIKQRRKNPKWEVDQVRKIGASENLTQLRSEILSESIKNLHNAAKRILITNRESLTGRRTSVNMSENMEISELIRNTIDELRALNLMKL